MINHYIFSCDTVLNSIFARCSVNISTSLSLVMAPMLSSPWFVYLFLRAAMSNAMPLEKYADKGRPWFQQLVTQMVENVMCLSIKRFIYTHHMIKFIELTSSEIMMVAMMPIMTFFWVAIYDGLWFDDGWSSLNVMISYYQYAILSRVDD